MKHTAYHEAGHTLVFWLSGRAGRIEFIDMQSNIGSFAFVRWREDDMARLAECLNDRGPLSAQLAKYNAQQGIMYSLARYVAESLIDNGGSASWLDDLLGKGVRGVFEDHDSTGAVRMAEALSGKTGCAWRFLRRTTRWTEEALANPRVGAVVDAVVRRLQRVKGRVSRPRLELIIERA